MGDEQCRCSTYAPAEPFADGYLIVTGHHPHCPDGGCARTRLTSRDVIEKLVAEVGRLRAETEQLGAQADADEASNLKPDKGLCPIGGGRASDRGHHTGRKRGSMMVGGIVIGLARGDENTLVHVRDVGHGSGTDECSIRVVERRRDDGEPVTIGLGDSIWWQGRDAMWTPKAVKDAGIDPGVGCGKTWDIHLPRVGYSH